jgi:Fe2+ transport system protein B
VLNVVSAMVDTSTSEALQLSRELDPTGKRTLLCITKVDQHKEAGLPDKIIRASQQMKIPMSQIFCVRNRTQQENDETVHTHTPST